jgi:hypothetical protein
MPEAHGSPLSALSPDCSVPRLRPSSLCPLYFPRRIPISKFYAPIGTSAACLNAKLLLEQHWVQKILSSQMKQAQPLEPPQPCEALPRSLQGVPLFLIGKDSCGHWVARDRTGICGGLFVSRSEAIRFAMRENGCPSWAVIMVRGGLELMDNLPLKNAA